MVIVNVHEAKTNLSRLLKRAEAGEDIVIARNGKPVARLTPVKKRGEPQFGSWEGRIELDPTVFDDSFFFDPLPEEELAMWEGTA